MDPIHELMVLEDEPADEDEPVWWLMSLPYSEYLRSHHWRRVKQEIMEVRGRECEFCLISDGGWWPFPASGRLVKPAFIVHHTTYERLGHEDWDDLKVVCSSCHAVIHGRKLRSAGYWLALLSSRWGRSREEIQSQALLWRPETDHEGRVYEDDEDG